MNIEIVVQGLAGQLLEKAHFHAGRIHVCWFDGKLRAMVSNHSDENHPVFFIAEAEEIKKGLTTGQWDGLKTKISNFLREKQ